MEKFEGKTIGQVVESDKDFENYVLREEIDDEDQLSDEDPLKDLKKSMIGLRKDGQFISVQTINLESMKDWEIVSLDYENDNIHGFYSLAFKKGTTIVIAFRGSNDLQDYFNDAQLTASLLNYQADFANRLINQVADKYPSYDIHLTGHSLGGWLAQKVALDNEHKKLIKSVVTFNAPGFWKSKSANDV